MYLWLCILMRSVAVSALAGGLWRPRCTWYLHSYLHDARFHDGCTSTTWQRHPIRRVSFPLPACCKRWANDGYMLVFLQIRRNGRLYTHVGAWHSKGLLRPDCQAAWYHRMGVNLCLCVSGVMQEGSLRARASGLNLVGNGINASSIVIMKNIVGRWTFTVERPQFKLRIATRNRLSAPGTLLSNTIGWKGFESLSIYSP